MKDKYLIVYSVEPEAKTFKLIAERSDYKVLEVHDDLLQAKKALINIAPSYEDKFRYALIKSPTPDIAQDEYLNYCLVRDNFVAYHYMITPPYANAKNRP